MIVIVIMSPINLIIFEGFRCKMVSNRPWALVQKRVSVGVMLCGTINMSVSKHEKEWWFPWTIGVPCALEILLENE